MDIILIPLTAPRAEAVIKDTLDADSEWLRHMDGVGAISTTGERGIHRNGCQETSLRDWALKSFIRMEDEGYKYLLKKRDL